MAKKKEGIETGGVEEVKPVFISQEFLRQIDSKEAEIKLHQASIEMAKLRVDKADRELNLLSANYTLKSKEKNELEKRVTELNKELTEKQNKYKEVVKDIAKFYDLPEKFGYDHITGEVK